MTNLYSIIFTCDECFEFALNVFPDVRAMKDRLPIFADEDGVEMFWDNKDDRDQAITFLDKHDLSVDWFDGVEY